jgi:pyruvate dehydrogenase E2 component (dihydrolipoamide acetyltransferase)
MAEAVLMLALSPTMEEGTITRWHKKEGEAVAQGDLLCEVETDKAAMEYESVNQGTLLAILVPAGGKAAVGAPIAVVGKPGEDVSAFRAAAAAPAVAAAPGAVAGSPVPRAPVAPGPRTEREFPAVEPPAGVARVDAAPRTAAARADAASPTAPPPMPSSGLRRIKASPLARRLARERRLDLGRIAGSGPGGRVVKQDLAAAKPLPPTGVKPGLLPGIAPAAAAKGEAALPLQDQRIPLSGKRKVIAQRLAESKFSAPHYYLKIDVDAGRFLETRERLNARLGEESRVSVNALLMKIVAEALKRHPILNSGWKGDHILSYARADIGLAVAQEDGLITPVVRDCGAKGVLAIERELSELIARARVNRLKPEEYTGATFTITNLGSYGILEFTAIINPPGSAILTVGRIRRVPVAEEGDRIVVRPQMILTLSCDHRVVDGAVGAAFLSDLKKLIEDPIDALYTLNL